MAINYLSLTGLSVYDQKIKAFINEQVSEGDKNSFKYVNLVDGVLKFYTVNPITDDTKADFEIELPEQDLSHLMTLVEGAVNGNVGIFDENGQIKDGGVALADLAKKTEVEAAVAGVQDSVDELGAYIGDIPEGYTEETIVGYINKKAEETLNAASGGSSESAASVLAALNTYKTENDAKVNANTEAVANAQATADAAQEYAEGVAGTHATDKQALEAAIALKADQSALEALTNTAATKEELKAEEDRAKAEEVRIEGLVTAETERATGVEADHEARLEEVEAFFKLAEGEQLDTALDTLKEIQDFVNNEGAAADEMVKDIADNAKAIADHVATDHDFASADAALKAELNAEIAKKADKTTVEGIDGRLVTAEGKVVTLEGKVATLEEEMDGVQADVATKAEQADLETEISAREAGDTQTLTDAKAHTDAEVAKDRTRLDALEADTHTHSNKAELDKIVEGDKAKWDAMEGNANAYTDEKITAEVTARNEAIATAKSEAITEAGTAADAKVKALEDGQVATNKADIAALTQTHATDKSALEAKDAEIAQAVEDLEASLVEITTEEINNLFA